MRRHRTTARGILLLAIVGATAGPAAAMPDSGYVPKKAKTVSGTTQQQPAGKRMIFPVLGKFRYSDDYGDPRGQGRHQGNRHHGAAQGARIGGRGGPGQVPRHVLAGGCMLYLNGVSGTTYLYVHLNNDLGMTNDNRGGCKPGVSFAPGLKSGMRVAAGEPIGFVGDSGDANGIEPHLHFEMHPNDGASTNPFTHLNRAYRLLFAAPGKADTALWLKGIVMAQQPEALKVNVSSLGVRTTGLKLNGISRPVQLAISPFTVIETVASRLAGTRATVWTEIFPNTLDAQLGKPNAITAERVLLSR